VSPDLTESRSLPHGSGPFRLVPERVRVRLSDLTDTEWVEVMSSGRVHPGKYCPTLSYPGKASFG